jgi:hypothetical protein
MQEGLDGERVDEAMDEDEVPAMRALSRIVARAIIRLDGWHIELSIQSSCAMERCVFRM